MAHDDGEAAATGGEDRLSALPDELIIKILLRLATDTAARTSVLSRRWRLLWCLLPELHFVLRAANAYSIRTALGAHDAPSLRQLLVLSTDGTPESMPEWLPVAARRLSGELIYIVQNKDDKEDEAEEGGAFLELPCFGRATNLSLVLGFNTLAVPPSGVFARLTELFLETIRFHGPCELGDAVSSARSPSLKELTILDSRGLSNFTIHSDSLVKMVLNSLKGLQQLNVVAPALQVLHVQFCFAHNPAGAQPVADISAPQLEILQWNDAFDSSSVQFSKMANLEWLGTYFFHVYGHGLENSRHNHNCLRLLQRFQFDAIPTLSLSLSYFPDINDYEYLMEDMTVLPDILFLNLTVLGNRHAIGPSLFHILRMCTGLRRLKIVLIVSKKPQAEDVCPLDCFCDLPLNWQTEQLLLNFLHEVEIDNLRGNGHEIAFLQRLFSWAAVLKEMTITFCMSITESKAKELCKVLLLYSRPEIRMKFYRDQRWRNLKVLYVPED